MAGELPTYAVASPVLGDSVEETLQAEYLRDRSMEPTCFQLAEVGTALGTNRWCQTSLGSTCSITHFYPWVA